MKKSCVFYLLALLPLTKGIGQAIDTETLDIEGDVLAWYDQQVGQSQTPLQVGTYYKVERKSRSSHPYYFNKTWVDGELIYNDQYYPSIAMMYDEENDELITKNPLGFDLTNQPVRLVKKLVNSFTIYGELFEYLEQDGLPEDGLYHVLHKGNQLKVVVRRVKELEIASHTDMSYEIRDGYYAIYQGEVKRIKRLGDFARLFPENKKEIRSAYRRHRGRIGKPAGDRSFISLLQNTEEIIK